MTSCRRFVPAVVLLASATCASATPPDAESTSRPQPPGQRARVVAGYGKLPLSFEPNQGQTDPQAKFLSRGDGYDLSLTSSEAVLSLPGKNCVQHLKIKANEYLKDKEKNEHCAPSPGSVLRMGLLGSDLNAQIWGEDQLPGKSNYFTGGDPSAWHTNIPNYRRVQYQNVYPGIDLVYYGNQRQLEHDFIVRPGADPKSIRLNFTGARRISIRGDGALELATGQGHIEFAPPTIYQEIAGVRHEVPGRYVRKAGTEVGFALGRYDRSEKLVIDPVLVYSTYIGDTFYSDYFRRIAIDSQNNMYIFGAKSVSGAFVSKLSADGSNLLYSSFFAPGANVAPQALAVDKQGDAYVVGYTGGYGYPVVNAFQPVQGGLQNCFISKLSQDGSGLIYSTFLGGKDSGCEGVAIDESGSAYVTGFASSDFPTAHPLFTKGGAFISKLSPSGSSLDYSTLFGGSNGEEGKSIAVDVAGEALITGAADSSDLPVTHALFPTCFPNTHEVGGCGNFFAAKFNSTGSGLIYSTYLGATDAANLQIATNAAGDAFIAGDAFENLPVANALYPTKSVPNTNGFVMRLNSSGSALIYSTYLTDTTLAIASGIAVDSSDNAYLTGFARAGLPLVKPLEPVVVPKRSDTGVFLIKVRSDGSAYDYSTFIGTLAQGFGVAVDSADEAYVNGFTFSTHFPLKNPFQTQGSGFIAKVSEGVAKFSITNVVDQSLTGPGGDLHYTITITNIGSGAGSGVVNVTSVRDRLRTCTVSNGDPCNFVALGGRASVDLAPLETGESRTILIYATAAKSAGDYNLIQNTATISTGPPLNQTGTASATTTVRETADIGIASSLVDNTNGLLHYVHAVTNLGPDNAHAVLLLDPLPANTTFVSASTTAGECSFHPTIGTYGAVRCPLNNPDAGGTVTVNVNLQASPAACPSVTNAATITSQSIDANSANDSTTVTATLPSSFCTLPPPPVLSYTLTVYNDLRSQASALNNHGDLLDTFENSYLFKHGPYQPIALPFGAFAFNDQDQVVGQASIDNKQVLQIYDNGNLQSLDFGELPPNVAVDPVAINNSGTIAGYEHSVRVDAQNPYYQQSFIYKKGTAKNIFPSGVFTRALNQKDEVVGDGNGTALLYSHGMVVANFRPKGTPPLAVMALDSSGRVSGYYYSPISKQFHGYIYSGGHFLDLGKANGPSSIVLGMNDCGELVGYYDDSQRGFIYTHGRFVGLDDLVNAPTGYLLQSSQINNNGLIFGRLFDPNTGGGGTFLLTPSTLEKCALDATIDNASNPATTVAGASITYKIAVKNLDTATAQFSVSDELDPTTTFVSCGVVGGAGTCTGSSGSRTVSAVLTSMEKGSAATVSITVKAASTYPPASVIMNTATLSSATTADYLSTAYTSVP